MRRLGVGERMRGRMVEVGGREKGHQIEILGF